MAKRTKKQSIFFLEERFGDNPRNKVKTERVNIRPRRFFYVIGFLNFK